jgi:hypothetical protein
MKRFLKKADVFLFDYNFINPFGFLRIAVAFLCLIFFACIANDIQNTVGLNGFTGREITEALTSEKFIPRISWLANPLIKAGCTDEKALAIIMSVYIAAMLFMLVGLFTRLSVFIVWIIHLMICYTSRLFYSYGVDSFTTIALFYCLVMPVGSYFSLDNLLLKKRKRESHHLYESFLTRVLQVHLCVAYFFEGLFKLIIPGWFSGKNIWQILMMPRFNIIDFSFLANHIFILKILGGAIVLAELLYPFMMCFKKTRKPWLIIIILMHIFIGAFMKIPFFGLIMIILNIAAFGWNEFYPFISNSFKRRALTFQPNH